MHASGTVPAMTAPHDTPPQFGHPSTWPAPAEQLPPAPRPRRTGLIAALTAGVLILMAAAGVGVWLVMRPTSPAGGPTTLTASGTLVLQRGQFVWQSAADPRCEGLPVFSDLYPGAQVVVTDAAGKTVAVGALGPGRAGGITTEGGLDRAMTCTMPFEVTGVPSGVGPYGVQLGQQAVLRYAENQLTGLQIGF